MPKIGINDRCANGGMMDSLSISPLAEDDGWEPMYTVDVTDEEWSAWQAHLKEHDKWADFWYNKTDEVDRKKRGPKPA